MERNATTQKDTVMNTKLSSIMKAAWNFFHITGKTFSECLKMSWANFKLVQQMQSGVVKFHFQKVDGSIREAYGTLQNAADKVKGDSRNKNENVQVYFDTEKQEFRCFKKWNLVV
ncbi:conserved hypothetical protein [uncultured Paludibacter sp.]|nr:conserved hypothetical protein [uncultured Paludibacter sp.]